MSVFKKLHDKHMENMRPDSTIPHTQEFAEAWEASVSYRVGFMDALELFQGYIEGAAEPDWLWHKLHEIKNNMDEND